MRLPVLKVALLCAAVLCTLLPGCAGKSPQAVEKYSEAYLAAFDAEAVNDRKMTYTIYSRDGVGQFVLVTGVINDLHNVYEIPDAIEGVPVTGIGEYAFSYAPVAELTLPDSLEYIAPGAFYDCPALAEVNLPASVTTIGDYAFYHCTSLTSVTIPASVQYIGGMAFSETPWYDALDGDFTIVGDGVLLKACGAGVQTVPDGVKMLSSAFCGNTALTEAVLPEGLITIGSAAFMDCTALRSVSIPSTVRTIGSSAFRGCTALTGLVVPDSVESAGVMAFEGVGGTVSLPRHLKKSS